MKSRPATPTIKALTDILTFGKHKGKSVEWVLENAPGYIVWLEEEKICNVEQEIYNLAQEMDYSEYGYDDGIDYQWMEEPF